MVYSSKEVSDPTRNAVSSGFRTVGGKFDRHNTYNVRRELPLRINIYLVVPYLIVGSGLLSFNQCGFFFLGPTSCVSARKAGVFNFFFSQKR